MSFKHPFLLASLVSLSSIAPGCASETNSPSGEIIAQSSNGAATIEPAAIDDAPIEADRVTLVVYGMSCPLCATNVDKQLLAVAGVQNVNVDLSTGRIDVALAASPKPTTRQLAAAIEKSGFTLKDIQSK